MQECMIGNTKTIINDSMCRSQTTEQRDQIFRRVSDIAYMALSGQAVKKNVG